MKSHFLASLFSASTLFSRELSMFRNIAQGHFSHFAKLIFLVFGIYIYKYVYNYHPDKAPQTVSLPLRPP